jgi:hypothetical protein
MRKKRVGMPQTLILAALIVVCLAGIARSMDFPGPAPGAAQMTQDGSRIVFRNNTLTSTWNAATPGLTMPRLQSLSTGSELQGSAAPAFSIIFADGQVLKASDLKVEKPVEVTRIPANPDAIRLAERSAGWQAVLPLVSTDGRFHVQWQTVLRDGSNYLHQALTITSKESCSPRQFVLGGIRAPGAKVIGSVDGSPVVAGDLFFACEHPMAQQRASDGEVTATLPRYRSLAPGESWTVRWVTGVVPEGQLRRGFLYYVERERVRPYSPLAYYISWFDIAAPDRKMDEAQCLAVIEAFGTELVKKRGAKLNGFVFDDGWDDNESLWQFHAGFPRGFAPLRDAAANYGGILGTWISPWGGYGQAKAERLKYGRQQAFETNRHGFSLAGPNYYSRFRDVCTDLLRRDGVKYLKFDGVGGGNASTGPGEEYGPDIEALLQLITDLRKVQPELFVNTTVGTWPSPYWLWYSDSIWRAGGDVDYAGKGTPRQQWLTYRDMTACQFRVLPAPLYPLNSLKSQGVMCAPLSLAGKLSNDPKDLIDDIHMAAASGTQLQEYFVRPAMLPAEVWDAMAKTLSWMQQNADVLVDTHWIGGDPGKGEVYGYASWSPRKGIFVLRNPADQPAEWAVDVQTVFELPRGALDKFLLTNLWQQSDQTQRPLLKAGQPHVVRLAPFEVLTFEAIPVSPQPSL